MTAFKVGRWFQLATDLEVWLHDREYVLFAGKWLRVVKRHGDGRVTVAKANTVADDGFTLSVAILERITQGENAR